MTVICYKDVIHLTQVIDGFELLVNSTIPKSAARALYAEQILTRKVN